MKVDIQSYKGVRDFYPGDYQLQAYIFNKWAKVVEGYGYQRYDASVIEYLELYKLKSQTNLEILQNQIYAFIDRGQRELALRPEMTPTLARMIAQKRQELSYPLRWYSIPNVWRYERPQKGRLREHWQLNVDIFGLEGHEADLELILIARDLLTGFGADANMYKIHISSRQVLEILLRYYCELNQMQIHDFILLFDKYGKITGRDFTAQAANIIGSSNTEVIFKKIRSILMMESLDKLPASIIGLPACRRLQSLMQDLKKAQVGNAVLDFKIVRGFDYYTDFVFEIFDTHKDNNRSMFGGGRYDHLLESFGVDPLTGAGFGMGDVTMAEFLKTHDLLPPKSSHFDLYVILMPEVSYMDAHKVCKNFRQEGLRIVIDSREVKTAKKIETALKRQAQYVLFISPNDLEDQVFNIRHLPTSKEEKMSLPRIITRLVS